MKATARNTDRSASGIAARVETIDWAQVTSDLDGQGCALLKGLLSPDECRRLLRSILTISTSAAGS